MVVTPDQPEPMRASLQVAPLTLNRSRPHSPTASARPTSSVPNNSGSFTRFSSDGTQCDSDPVASVQPLHDGEAQITLDMAVSPIFHKFIRAYHSFDPNVYDPNITIPLAEEDLILVHLTHSNGWAYGTVLTSGARGWLPLNYCYAYDPDEIHSLLTALVNFWDLLNHTTTYAVKVFGDQEFMKGIIAGVRNLLERTECLTKNAPLVLDNNPLRSVRKLMLSELSGLVKIGKRIPFDYDPDCDLTNVVDELIYKAINIVVYGVRFLDIVEQHHQQSLSQGTLHETTNAILPRRNSHSPSDEDDSHQQSRTPPISYNGKATYCQSNLRFSYANALSSPPVSQLPIGHRVTVSQDAHSTNTPRVSMRVSSSLNYRSSLSGTTPYPSTANFVSERLARCHDLLLSHFGSFIGRLHLHSQSLPQLGNAIKQSAESACQLLSVVNAVHHAMINVGDTLSEPISVFHDHIHCLVQTASAILTEAISEDSGCLMAHETSTLLEAATGCVKAAGDCVSQSRWAMERTGDFEIADPPAVSLRFDVRTIPTDKFVESNSHNHDSDYSSRSNPVSQLTLAVTNNIPSAFSHSNSSSPMSASIESTSSRMHMFDSTSTATESDQVATLQTAHLPLPTIASKSSSSTYPTFSTCNNGTQQSNAITSSSNHKKDILPIHSRPSLPPLPRISTIDLTPRKSIPADNVSIENKTVSCSEHAMASSAESMSTYLSRGSETSIISHTSTRATTPDKENSNRKSIATRSEQNGPSSSRNNSRTITEDDLARDIEIEELESKLLAKTYAHELLLNKEGQITGGTLPALVERVTAHEATPDSFFSWTFRLTFRLFCTSTQLAEALIDRFDYVEDARHIAAPVRLRVVNFFKNWLETFWKDENDTEALDVIEAFVQQRVCTTIPQAGHRLLELVHNIRSQGSIIPPRTGSSLLRSHNGTTVAPSEPPTPITPLSRSQQNALFQWKAGGKPPNLLDFDPLEIARQLTLKQMSVFCSIPPDELIGSRWMKRNGMDTPHVKAMSTLSTDISNLVAESILQNSEVKKRATTIKHWIKVAQHCLELKNYDGLMAIICSLNSSTISRLRKTWDAISPRRRTMLQTLQSIVDMSHNNRALRSQLSGQVPPCLPFLGMYLTDLTFVDIGNPDTKSLNTGKVQTSPSDHDVESHNSDDITIINFDKYIRTAKIIDEIRCFQCPYSFGEIPDMQEWIASMISRVHGINQGNSQVSYYRKSLLLEPHDITTTTGVSSSNNSIRTPIDGPRGDFFGWMRDRSGNSSSTVPT